MRLLALPLLLLLAFLALPGASADGGDAPRVIVPMATLGGATIVGYVDATGPFTLTTVPPATLSGCGAPDGASLACKGNVVFTVMPPAGADSITFVATDGEGHAHRAKTKLYPSSDFAVTVSPSSLTLKHGESPSGTLVVTVSNAGPTAASGSVALGVTTMTNSVGGDCPGSTVGPHSVRRCPVATLQPGESRSYTFPVELVGAGTSYFVAAAVPGAGTGLETVTSVDDPNLANNVARGAIENSKKSVKVIPPDGGSDTVAGRADAEIVPREKKPAQLTLRLTETPTSSDAEGRSPTWDVAFAVTNVGGLPTKAVVSLLASDALFAPACGGEGQALRCDLGAMRPGESREMTLKLYDASGSASVSAVALGNGNLHDHSAVDTPGLEALVPELSLAREAGPTRLLAGEEGTFTFMVKNIGVGKFFDRWGSLELAADGGAFIDGGGCRSTTTGATCPIGELYPGDSNLLTLRIAAPNTPVQAWSPQLQWSIRGAPPGSASGGPVEVTPARTDLEFVSFTATPGNPKSGDSVTLSMTLTNHGPVGVTDAFVTMPVPSGFDVGDQSAGPCVIQAGTIRCAMGAIPAGATITRSFATTAHPGSYSVTATLGSSAPDPNGANNAKSLSIVVTPA